MGTYLNPEAAAAAGLRTFTSREQYRASLIGLAPPTADDCTVLRDGTRIDTPAKARAYMAEVRALIERGQAADAAAARERL